MKKNIFTFIKNYKRDKDGATAVEFGLVSLGFVLILFGVIETGRLFLTWNAFQYALENTARTALADDTLMAFELEAMIADELTIFSVSVDDIGIDITFPVVSGINFVQIDGTYTFQTIASFLPDQFSNIVMSTTSRLPRP